MRALISYSFGINSPGAAGLKSGRHFKEKKKNRYGRGAGCVPMPATNGNSLLSKNGVVFSVRGLTRVYEMGEVKVHALRGIYFEHF